MIYYAIKQQLSSSYEEMIILNCTTSEVVFNSVKKSIDKLSDDQYTYKVYRLDKSDYNTLKECSNHTGERQTMLGNFIDRGSVLS